MKNKGFVLAMVFGGACQVPLLIAGGDFKSAFAGFILGVAMIAAVVMTLDLEPRNYVNNQDPP